MKTSTVAVLGIILGPSAASAAPLRELSVKPFNRIWSELSDDRRTVKIMAESIYSNKCFMDKEIYKSKQQVDTQIHYRMYRFIESDRNCIKIYQPTGRTHSVDEFPVEDLNRLELITINGVALSHE